MKLAEIRKEKGLSQSKLSMLSGVNMNTITKYEQGISNINNANAQILYKLAKALDCSIEDLLEIDKIE